MVSRRRVQSLCYGTTEWTDFSRSAGCTAGVSGWSVGLQAVTECQGLYRKPWSNFISNKVGICHRSVKSVHWSLPYKNSISAAVLNSVSANFTLVWPCCIVTNSLIIIPTDALISQIHFVMKLYMFRVVRLSIIRSLFTVHLALVYVILVWRQLSSGTRMELAIPALFESCLQTCMTYTIAECTVNKLLMMDRGTARNM